MHVTRIHADDDGESHFTDIDVPLVEETRIGRMSTRQAASGLIFRENDADYDLDWHCAPRRQYIVMLDGEVEITVSDGESRRFRGGDVVLVEDVTGKGHRSRHVRAEPRRSLFIPLDP